MPKPIFQHRSTKAKEVRKRAKKRADVWVDELELEEEVVEEETPKTVDAEAAQIEELATR